MARSAKKSAGKRAATKKAPVETNPEIDPEPTDLGSAAEPVDLTADADPPYSDEHLNSEPEEETGDAATPNDEPESATLAGPETSMNSQVKDAVRQTANAVIGGQAKVLDITTKTALTQSLAMAVQDAAEHLRRTQILAESATALGMKRVAEGRENGQDTIDAASASVLAATRALAEVGDTVAKLRKDLDIA